MESETGIPIRESLVERRATIRPAGPEISLDKYRLEKTAIVAESIARKVELRLGEETPLLDTVFEVGDGGETMLPFLRIGRARTVLAEDAQMANLLGFLASLGGGDD
ncbi:MAG: hypothetical protein M0031_03470 [Thermaerobacter sp.]|nr:hypothetical protein [Thermaerobacter sp.]